VDKPTKEKEVATTCGSLALVAYSADDFAPALAIGGFPFGVLRVLVSFVSGGLVSDTPEDEAAVSRSVESQAFVELSHLCFGFAHQFFVVQLVELARRNELLAFFEPSIESFEIGEDVTHPG